MADGDKDNDALRARGIELLAKARARAAEIQRAAGAITHDDAVLARLAAAASALATAEHDLALALDSPSFGLRSVDLAAYESAINSGEASAALAEATASLSAASGRAQDLAAATAATRAEVQTLAHDVFERRIFDPYLHFASAEEEEAYRKREAETRRYIEEQLARGTPEGALNASGGMLGHMLEAHQHGAGNSPEFMPRWNALVEKAQRQREALRASGLSTEEFDRHLAASVRRFLKAQGLSDQEIEAKLAGGDPLAAVKPYLQSDRDSRILERQIRLTTAARPALPSLRLDIVHAPEEQAPDAPLTISVDSAAEVLKSAGVQVTGPEQDAPHVPSHRPHEPPTPGAFRAG